MKIKKLKTRKIISDITEEEVIKANSDHYNKSAKSYDEIVINQKSHNRLRKSLEYSINQLSKFKRNIKALDACGGTGNASFILNEMGCDTYLVDLSQSMIDNFKIFCKNKNISIRSYKYEIKDFFLKDEIKFDLIIFSAALHHLKNPEEVLRLAKNSLSPKGMIITLADPTTNVNNSLFKLLSIFDRGLNYLFTQPELLFSKISKILLSKKANNLSKKQNSDWITEIHASYGIDDLQLIEILKEENLNAVWHDRYTGGYTKIFQFIFKILRFDTSFSLVLSNHKYSTFNLSIDK